MSIPISQFIPTTLPRHFKQCLGACTFRLFHLFFFLNFIEYHFMLHILTEVYFIVPMSKVCKV